MSISTSPVLGKRHSKQLILQSQPASNSILLVV